MKWSSMLLSNRPCRLPSGYDTQMLLEGYVIALDDSDYIAEDLRVAVTQVIKGVPEFFKWAPGPPEFAQLVRDAAARRLHDGDILEERILAPEICEPEDEERIRMKEKADKLVAEIVAASDPSKPFIMTELLARRQPADGDYGWADRQRKRDERQIIDKAPSRA